MKKKLLPWVGLLVCSALVLWPLFKSGFFVSDDGDWMIIRLTSFYQSLAQGQFPVRWLSRLNYSYGYPVANFLYPGFLYVGSFLHFFGIPYIPTVKIIIIASFLATSIILFVLLKKKFTTVASFMGVVSFMFSPYISYDIYKRGSIGEMFAFIWAALLLLSFHTKRMVLAPLSLALLVVSHNTLAFLFILSYGFILVWKGSILKKLNIFFLGLGMSSFFWLPALYERKFVKFSNTLVADPGDYFLGMSKLMLFGIPTCFALVLLFTKKFKFSEEMRPYVYISIFSYFLTTGLSQVFWNSELLRTLVQFPFRFLAIPALFGSLFVANVFQKLSYKNVYVVGASFFIIWIIGIYSIQKNISYTDKNEGYYETNEHSTTVQNEYMPKWVQVNPKQRPANIVELISGDAQIEPRTQKTQRIDFSIQAYVDTVIQINTIYYPGWGVAIDGVLAPIDYNNEKGVIQLTVPQGNHRVEAKFRETIFRLVADFVSIISFVLYLVWAKKQAVKK